jgi:1-aminocyclopropane-1-carboxylate deaminase/D-cysteine desulfhydrase-like pyridoxal-dependent ACC family enzyme
LIDIYKYTICNSPVDLVSFKGRDIFVKRDDLLNPNFSGNKARKFFYFLTNDFPNIRRVVSYGSNQSNAMYSLSVLAKLKGWEFIYYTKHISKYLKNNPSGNYKYALLNGMKMIVSENIPKREDIEDEHTIFVEEGGRQLEAKFGIKMLAQEIKLWQQAKNIDNLNIFLPSGTGTTALFLQKYLLEIDSRYHSIVYTTPCVGDIYYLKSQFDMLENNPLKQPTIIRPPKKYHFGKLYKELYLIWRDVLYETAIEFDLLYDPVGWITLLNRPKLFESSKPLMYIHQGGLKGNETMLERYVRKFPDI